MQHSNPQRKYLFFFFSTAQQGVYYRGQSADCSFTFQTQDYNCKGFDVFPLSAQQSYSSAANSSNSHNVCLYAAEPAWLPQSAYAFDGVCFKTVPEPIQLNGGDGSSTAFCVERFNGPVEK